MALFTKKMLEDHRFSMDKADEEFRLSLASMDVKQHRTVMWSSIIFILTSIFSLVSLVLATLTKVGFDFFVALTVIPCVVLGLVFGVYQFLNERRKYREAKDRLMLMYLGSPKDE